MTETNRPDPDPLFAESLDLLTDMATAYINDGTKLDPRSLRVVAKNLEKLASRLERDHS